MQLFEYTNNGFNDGYNNPIHANMVKKWFSATGKNSLWWSILGNFNEGRTPIQ